MTKDSTQLTMIVYLNYRERTAILGHDYKLKEAHSYPISCISAIGKTNNKESDTLL